jgi:hypothetical protein
VLLPAVLSVRSRDAPPTMTAAVFTTAATSKRPQAPSVRRSPASLSLCLVGADCSPRWQQPNCSRQRPPPAHLDQSIPPLPRLRSSRQAGPETSVKVADAAEAPVFERRPDLHVDIRAAIKRSPR